MDYMALQLTEMSGTTAFQDRMGEYYPDMTASGRIVQGYAVSGPLDSQMAEAIDRDLADSSWRTLFHEALRSQRRFQRGLFDFSHGMNIAGQLVPGPAAFLRLTNPQLRIRPSSVEHVRELSRMHPRGDEGYAYEYGFALVKTAAALRHTVRLCQNLELQAATDSEPHYRLLEATRRREKLAIQHHYLGKPVAEE
jgi:hypothetical protein